MDIIDNNPNNTFYNFVRKRQLNQIIDYINHFTITMDNIKYAWYVLCEMGRLDLLQIIYDKYGNQAISNDTIDVVIFNNRMDVIKWYIDNIDPDPKITREHIDTICRNGYIHMLDWLDNRVMEKVHKHLFPPKYIFDKVVNFDNYHHQLVHNKHQFSYTSNTINLACKYGHVQILDWFHMHPQ